MSEALFDNKVLRLYLVVYDGEPGRAYSFTCPDKAYSSIISSVREYMDDESTVAHAVYKQFGNVLRENWGVPYLPMQFNNLQICVYTFELDRWNHLHQVLAECHGEVGPKLRDKVASLFSEPTL